MKTGSVGEDFESALHRDGQRAGCAVHQHGHFLVAELALICVHAVLGHEMLQRTFGDYLIGLPAAPAQDFRHIVPGFVLKRSAPLGGESADSVTGESAGEIAAHIPQNSLVVSK